MVRSLYLAGPGAVVSLVVDPDHKVLEYKHGELENIDVERTNVSVGIEENLQQEYEVNPDSVCISGLVSTQSEASIEKNSTLPNLVGQHCHI
jgi:hypothetical protein